MRRFHPRGKVNNISRLQSDMGIKSSDKGVIFIANMDKFLRTGALYHSNGGSKAVTSSLFLREVWQSEAQQSRPWLWPLATVGRIKAPFLSGGQLVWARIGTFGQVIFGLIREKPGASARLVQCCLIEILYCRWSWEPAN